jgi:hypothetical protein
MNSEVRQELLDVVNRLIQVNLAELGPALAGLGPVTALGLGPALTVTPPVVGPAVARPRGPRPSQAPGLAPLRTVWIPPARLSPYLTFPAMLPL